MNQGTLSQNYYHPTSPLECLISTDMGTCPSLFNPKVHMTWQHFLSATFYFSTYKFLKGARTLLHEPSSICLYLHCSGPHGHWNSMLTVFLLMNIRHIFKTIFTWPPNSLWCCWACPVFFSFNSFLLNFFSTLLQNSLKQFFFLFLYLCGVFFGVMLQVSSHPVRCFLFRSFSISQGFT